VPSSFGPDKVTNYEVGLKGILADRTVSFDVALFDIEWKNIQLQDTDAATEFTYTTNGGKARSRGLETEIGWRPYKGLNIEANATFLNAVLAEDLTGLASADTLTGRSGDRLPASARFTSNLSIQQDFPIASSLTGFVGGNWSFVGSRESAFMSSAADSTPRFTLPSYSLVDVQTGITYGSGWRASLFLRNALNKLGVITADNRNGTSVTSVNYLQPRTVGMNVSKEF
jgi:outer membrane receptor protein involved in Fe transport